MKKLFLLLCIIFILSGCSKIESVTTTIEQIDGNKIMFDCSEEINKHKKGPINSVGYLCSLHLNTNTLLQNSRGKQLTMEDFSQGDVVFILLSEPQKISEKNREFKANEVTLLLP